MKVQCLPVSSNTFFLGGNTGYGEVQMVICFLWRDITALLASGGFEHKNLTLCLE